MTQQQLDELKAYADKIIDTGRDSNYIAAIIYAMLGAYHSGSLDDMCSTVTEFVKYDMSRIAELQRQGRS